MVGIVQARCPDLLIRDSHLIQVAAASAGHFIAVGRKADPSVLVGRAAYRHDQKAVKGKLPAGPLDHGPVAHMKGVEGSAKKPQAAAGIFKC